MKCKIKMCCDADRMPHCMMHCSMVVRWRSSFAFLEATVCGRAGLVRSIDAAGRGGSFLFLACAVFLCY